MNEKPTSISLPLRVGSAVLLAVTGLVHLYLVITGTGGLLGTMFVLNAIAGIALAIGVIWLPARLLPLTVILSLLFFVASLVALLLALTAGLFGITETWGNPFVVVTLIVELIGVVVTAVFLTRLRTSTTR